MIFFLPLYVDSAPSHVLAFLREMEEFCRDNDVCLHIYWVANNGFIEGRQNQPLMQLFQNFCAKSRLDWRGGLGIGGGVMLNVTKILFLVNVAVLLLSMALSGLTGGTFLPPDALGSFAVNTLLLLFLNAGALFYIFSMSRAVRDGNRPFGEKYTRILLPSFVFILFADAFFAVISLFSGGIFRGWLARKKL
ncbi:MAG: hypothetical protein LUG57_06560 [Oscillospiraceae bacterium]|nr:hypothetical protein [Oscillospiraceae bacterium]